MRRIDVPVKEIRWSDSGELVAIISESSFYILRLDSQAVNDFLSSGEEPEEDGLEDAFELLNEVSERVRTGAAFRDPLLCSGPIADATCTGFYTCCTAS